MSTKVIIPQQHHECSTAFPLSVTTPENGPRIASRRGSFPLSVSTPERIACRRGSCDPSEHSLANEDRLLSLHSIGIFLAKGKNTGRFGESIKDVLIESNKRETAGSPPKDLSAFKPMVFFTPSQLMMKETKGVASQLSLVDILTAATKMSLDEEETTAAEEESQGLDVIKQLQQKRTGVGPKSLPIPKPVAAGTPIKTEFRPYPSTRSPQVFLDVMLRTLGYPTKVYKAVETAYYNEPTQLQTSSYHARLQEIIRSQDESKIREIMTCGISTNPCNRHGESLLHSACRNGMIASVRTMLECGASVQVSDNTGRSILHSALFASTPCFEIVDLILQRDIQLLQLSDRLGTPLSYIPRDQWGLWIDFLYAKRHAYFPNCRIKRMSMQQQHSLVSSSATKLNQPPNSCPLADPSNALTPEIAAMVVSGKLSPEEAKFLMMDEGSMETDTYGAHSDDDSFESDDDSIDSDDDSIDSDEDSCSEDNENGEEEEESEGDSLDSDEDSGSDDNENLEEEDD